MEKGLARDLRGAIAGRQLGGLAKQVDDVVRGFTFGARENRIIEGRNRKQRCVSVCASELIGFLERRSCVLDLLRLKLHLIKVDASENRPGCRQASPSFGQRQVEIKRRIAGRYPYTGESGLPEGDFPPRPEFCDIELFVVSSCNRQPP